MENKRMAYEYVTPRLNDPELIDVTCTFACKWCGGERRTVRGITRAHSCPVHHSPHEDMVFVLSELGERSQYYR